MFREREREGEREGEKHQCVVASHVPPHWGPGLKPRHVPWLGIELATLWFAGPCSTHWATPARAEPWKKSKKQGGNRDEEAELQMRKKASKQASQILCIAPGTTPANATVWNIWNLHNVIVSILQF